MFSVGRVLGVLGVGIVAAGCNSKASTNPIPDGFDHASLIRSWATDVIVPTYAALAVDARALRDAVKSYQLATASGSDEREQLLDEARQAWGTAMEQCQEAELMQMGPAGPSGPTGLKGGENLRDELYSWPTVSACRVDQELVDGTYADTDFFERETVNAYGMDALEYLLFNEASAHSCPPQANLDDAWDALGEEELTKRRASYAASVAEHVLATAEELQARWDPASGNFIEQFIQPGTGGSVYDNNRCVIDEVFASLFYIEFKVKDMKLGIPSGVRPECVETQCPEAVESRWAKRSLENIRANYEGFERLFWGGEGGLGFDDYLIGIEARDLEARMRLQFDSTISTLEAIPGPLADAVVNDDASVMAAYDALKSLTDILKTEFVSKLSLRVPNEGDGDND